jgi:ATP-binding cassette subfamily F protein 3
MRFSAKFCLIQFRNLALRGARRPFEDATLQIHPAGVGLIGATGSGVSLFALLRGELHPERGECEVPARWMIASSHKIRPHRRLRSTCRWRCAELRDRARARCAGKRKRRGTYLPMTVTASLSRNTRLPRSTARAKARAAALLSGLGFDDAEFMRPVSSAAGACGSICAGALTRLTCCCSTSPPTTSISKPWCGSKNGSPPTAARSCWYRTNATSSTHA